MLWPSGGREGRYLDIDDLLGETCQHWRRFWCKYRVEHVLEAESAGICPEATGEDTNLDQIRVLEVGEGDIADRHHNMRRRLTEV